MTSLDSPGFSITLLKANPEMLDYIDAPTTATGWCAPQLPASVWSQDTSNRGFESTEARDIKEDIIDVGHAQCKSNLPIAAAKPHTFSY